MFGNHRLIKGRGPICRKLCYQE